MKCTANCPCTQIQEYYKYVMYQAAEFAVVSELISFTELTCAMQWERINQTQIGNSAHPYTNTLQGHVGVQWNGRH